METSTQLPQGSESRDNALGMIVRVKDRIGSQTDVVVDVQVRKTR